MHWTWWAAALFIGRPDHQGGGRHRDTPQPAAGRRQGLVAGGVLSARARVAAVLLIGSPHLPLARRQQQLAINARIREASEGVDSGSTRPDPPPWFTSLVELNRNLGALPLTGDTPPGSTPTIWRASPR